MGAQPAQHAASMGICIGIVWTSKYGGNIWHLFREPYPLPGAGACRTWPLVYLWCLLGGCGCGWDLGGVEAEAARRRKGLLAPGEELQQLELLERGEVRALLIVHRQCARRPTRDGL
jgi:hypothetical protein